MGWDKGDLQWSFDRRICCLGGGNEIVCEN